MSERVPFVQVDTSGAPALDGVQDGAALAGTEVGLLIVGKDTSNNAQFIKTGTDGAVAITDNAGSLTVDGSVSISGTPNVAVTSSVLPTGAATESTLSAASGKLPATLGQKTMANSMAVVLASDQSSIPVTGTVTATNPSVGSNGSAIPSSSTEMGASDGTNLQAIRAFDADTGGGTQYVLGVGLRKSASGGSVEAGTSSDPLRVDPTGTTSQPVTASSLPLPTGAATAAKQPALGAAGSASSDVISVQGVASMTALKVDGSAVTQPVSGSVTATVASTTVTNTVAVSAASLPLPAGASTAAKQPALGTAGSASSDVISVQGVASMTALKVDGSAVTQPVSGTVTITPSGTQTVSGTVTANIGTSGSLALDATLTGGTQKAIARGGAKGATTAADVTSTAAGANHNALDVSIYDANGNIQPSMDAVGRPGFQKITDGTNTLPTMDAVGRAGFVKLTDGTNTAPTMDAAARKGFQAITDGTNTAAVSASNALKVDGSAVTQPVSGTVTITPSGTQTVSGTVTANIGTSGSLALDATLTGGTQKAITRGGAKGSTTAADVTSTAEGTNNQALDVQIWHGGATKDPTQIRALASGTDTVTIVPSGTQTVSGTVTATVASTTVTNTVAVSGTTTSNQGTAAAVASGWPVKLTDGTNTAPTMDVAARKGFQAITDGTNTAAVSASNALKVDGSAVTQPVSSTTLATAANQTTLASNQTTVGSQTTKINDGTNTAAVKAASTVAAATDPALVVVVSPNSSDAIKGQATMGSGTTTTILSPTSGSSQSYNILRIWPSGTFSMIVQAQGSVDNVTWTPLYGITPSQNVARDNNTAGTMATYAVGGYPYLRLTTTSFTSGSMVVDYSLSRSSQFYGGGAQGATPFPTVSIGDSVGGIMPCGQTGASGITTIPADAYRNSYTVTTAQTNNIFTPVNGSGVASLTGNIGPSYSIMRIQVGSTAFTGITTVIEGTVNGATWTTIPGVSTSGAVVTQITTVSQLLTYNVSGYSSVRSNSTVSVATGTMSIDYYLSRSSNINYGGSANTPYGITSIGDANGQAAVAGSGTATIPTTSALGVSLRPSNLNYFSASAGAISPAANATDILTIYGNATTTVVVTRFTIQTTQTTAGVNTWVFTKRSSADTGGTPAAATAVPYDSTGAGASATVLSYTVNPTPGTSVGNAKVVKLFASTTTTGPEETFDWDLTCGGISKGMALRGTSQGLVLNFQGLAVPTGLSVQWNIEWYEY